MAATSKSMPGDSHPDPGLRLAARSGLDVMLTDAMLEDGGVNRFLKPRAAARTVAGLARHPHRTARDATGLGVDLARVAAGQSELRPAKGDRHFGDRAWQDNWLLHRLMQSYLTGDTVDQLISDADLDWRSRGLRRRGVALLSCVGVQSLRLR